MKTAEELLNGLELKTIKAEFPIYSKETMIDALREYAEIVSIEFAEWLSGLGYQQYDGADRWISQEESGNKVFTTKELYQRFLLNHKI